MNRPVREGRIESRHSIKSLERIGSRSAVQKGDKYISRIPHYGFRTQDMHMDFIHEQ